MPTFEGLVRPFTNTSTAPTTGVDSVPQPASNAVLFINGAGQTKSGGYSMSFSITYYAKVKHREQTTPEAGSLIATRRGVWTKDVMPAWPLPPPTSQRR